jgi:hypothetical protein
MLDAQVRSLNESAASYDSDEGRIYKLYDGNLSHLTVKRYL